ncbi:excisionase family DNA-binding protein [Bacteroides fragilis]
MFRDNYAIPLHCRHDKGEAYYSLKYTHMTEQRKLLSTREAAEYCGFKLSYFRKLMMRRAIPMYKPTGKLCFFKKEDLDAFLTGVRISSQEEIAEEAGRYLAGRK